MKERVISATTKTTAEVDAFLELLQEQYTDALLVEDQAGIFETCGVLAVTYAAIGMPELAQRWSLEYINLMFETKKN